MSESKHTPGPWRAKRINTFDEPGHVILWLDERGEHRRRLDYRGNFIERDARLIAAAPELLEALKLTERGDTDIPSDIRARIRSAIDKAEGGSHE